MQHNATKRCYVCNSWDIIFTCWQSLSKYILELFHLSGNARFSTVCQIHGSTGPLSLTWFASGHE